MVKLKKKRLSRGSFRTHGRVIGNKNFFIFGLISLCEVKPSVFIATALKSPLEELCEPLSKNKHRV